MRTLIANGQYDAAWTYVRRGYGSNLGPGGTIGSSAPTAVLSPTGTASAASAAQNALARVTLTTPIALGTPTLVSVVPAQARRRLLTIQNNSSATPPDTAPTLYIGIGQPAVPGQCLQIAPGAGVSWEVNPPLEALYVAWGAYSDTNGTAIVVGMIQQGVQQLASVSAASASASASTASAQAA